MSLLGPNKVHNATKDNFDRLLCEGSKSVLVFPGGARETMLCDSQSSTIHLFTGHEGFLKIAMEHKAILLPLFSFPSHREFQSLLPVAVDRWFWDNLKLAWNFLVPGRENVGENEKWVVFGDPIKSEEYTDIKKLKEAYYKEVERIFETHKPKVPQLRNHKLNFIDADVKDRGIINVANFYLIAGMLYCILQI
eukprot:CAMPEP_0168541870 /NCGR_PEP_ID=MMETSP0413-20121227/1046_1 /TAXON_ID=136452 /ORGANISM="Filamoeba nolandi, Strain NC-AS-23-1" /LENGTH=192 /DNA_ID=CAMNT_0008571711 /DNA_START=138 /DNA_END=716 /DNA_ORIENTATION=+